MLDGRKLVLVSVADKRLLMRICPTLVKYFQLVSTGGTFTTLQELEIPCIPVEEVTGLAEMLQGRVKTLHPAILAPLLAPDTPVALEELRVAGFTQFAGVIGNLYQFAAAIAKPGVTLLEAIEKIDIGGLTFLRATAKNFMAGLFAICDPDDYESVVAELDANDGKLSYKTRLRLALKVFQMTREYETAIAEYLAGQLEQLD